MRLLIVEINTPSPKGQWVRLYKELYQLLPMGMFLVVSDSLGRETVNMLNGEQVRLPHKSENWGDNSEFLRFRDDLIDGMEARFGPDLVMTIDHESGGKGKTCNTKITSEGLDGEVDINNQAWGDLINRTLKRLRQEKDELELILHSEHTVDDIANTLRVVTALFPKITVHLSALTDFETIERNQELFSESVICRIQVDPKVTFLLLHRSGKSHVHDVLVNRFFLDQIAAFFALSRRIGTRINVKLSSRHYARPLQSAVAILNMMNFIQRRLLPTNHRKVVPEESAGKIGDGKHRVQ